jgi:hypothetical protein
MNTFGHIVITDLHVHLLSLEHLVAEFLVVSVAAHTDGQPHHHSAPIRTTRLMQQGNEAIYSVHIQYSPLPGMGGFRIPLPVC